MLETMIDNVNDVLRNGSFPYRAEIVPLSPNRATVILHGRRGDWVDDEPVLTARLRYAESARPRKIVVSYRFMALDALAL